MYIPAKTTFIALAALVAVGQSGLVADASTLATKEHSSLVRRGDGTFYNMEGGYTACGEKHSDSEHYAAVAPSWFTTGNHNNDPICRKCALVKGPKGQVKVHINDICPPCARDSIDMTPAAFSQIADQADGRVSVSWEFTDC
ncbi:RlpA-like double-psi beta-barrel-protein domain-containing protein-containing protein [Syncephalis pseudoplumigaleata]|uniref:RlpA-like double-psi beta-barrel-protein domain-containing protein-containing protein n=1 Tax=Syncephalis pseudoplumigaleata TaxID=1712513 RepID=A0A4P9Z073_9FUNG|nr:RlpA-like double-psi beta-barrel-protein domain-containing protein-containing protein [Syncephalis pseudoplumigaleata]|eukprot:RKP25853.1 RlpA-like double-psi beta-barrel-protein domain-containing protein-containing protein [Syncephalis pseudoplumigaleata]